MKEHEIADWREAALMLALQRWGPRCVYCFHHLPRSEATLVCRDNELYLFHSACWQRAKENVTD